jgi:isopropylmalate/homocitrate/citramalate synthase
MPDPALNSADQAVLDATISHIEDRVRILREAEPYLIDMSAREATLSSYLGHTLDDKIALYEMARDLGFHDFGLSNFFAFPSASDGFMEYLVNGGQSLDPFFTTVAVEPLVDDQPFPMGPAATQTMHYGIPNTILLVETRPATLAAIGTDNQKMLDDLRRHIREYRRLLPSPTERRGRIYVRLADPFDTYDDDPSYLLQIIKMLGEEEITGILFEDVKGTRFPFETYALVKMMRHYHPKPRKILAHPHTANGTEDAAALECILAGGDGVWSGFTPQAAQGGHGSALMFLTNLMRARNPHVRRLFNTEKFQDVAERMWRIHDHIDIPPNTPVVGERAYLYVDKYFEQTDEPRDLDPKLIGRKAGYQIMPSWAPAYVLQRRLAELGYERNISHNSALHAKMRAMMNAALNEGRQTKFDDPEHLATLVEQALAELGDIEPQADDSASASALTQRYR